MNTTQILQKLIQFDTTNPPGNEYLVINWARDLLAEHGIESTLLAKDPSRPNLLARLKGTGNAPPLLLQGHVDVVTTEGQDWEHPPFGGEIHDGYVWGRGALDMKGAVAMMIAAFLKAKDENVKLPGDVILCLLADEEAGGEFGAQFLVEEHPDYFEGVKFALGEFGGFSMETSGTTFYPIMVAEKQICWTRITLRGPGGHGSMIHHGTAMSRLGQVLRTLDKNLLPFHVTPPVRMMIEAMADALPAPKSTFMRQMLNPKLASGVIGLMGEAGKNMLPLLHNTVNPTIVRGGDKINVIPSEITLDLDGRLLPGLTPDQMLAELHSLLGDDLEIEVIRHDPGPAEPNMAFFDALAGILKKQDPQGHPVPFVISGVTDARHFSRLGIQTYGFTPMNLPSDFRFASTVHAANERVPADALDFGTQAIFEALQVSN
jgi:acetylornithine deacetylase/succinyl-diaminopimelate desuccinylase-like protein